MGVWGVCVWRVCKLVCEACGVCHVLYLGYSRNFLLGHVTLLELAEIHAA